MAEPDRSKKSIINFFNESIDKIIGKRAHVEFITNDYFVKMLVNRYREEMFSACIK